MCHSKETAVLMFVLVASGLRAAGGQAPSDPCAQITAAQVTAALGETVAAGQKAGTKTCSWSTNKPTHQILSLMYSPPGDWNTRKTYPMSDGSWPSKGRSRKRSRRKSDGVRHAAP